jgi:hypothetical protein
MEREPSIFEVQEALMASARRARGEAVAAMAETFAKSLWSQLLRLQRAWLTRRHRALPARGRPRTPTSLVHGLYGDVEYVTDAALGADVARLGRIRLDLAAQAQDLHVDRAVVHVVVVQP